MRIVIPVFEENGLDAKICDHFGRTPFFAVVDLDKSGHVLGQNTVSNSGGHFCEGISFILNLKPDLMIAYGMGQRVVRNLQSAQIAVLRTDAATVKEAIEAYNRGELEELTEGCHKSHNQ